MNGDEILSFRTTQKELKANGIFLTINNSHDKNRGLFIVCDNKHQTRWRSLLSDTPKKSCPIGVFISIEEARAFAVGMSVANNKIWKYIIR